MTTKIDEMVRVMTQDLKTAAKNGNIHAQKIWQLEELFKCITEPEPYEAIQAALNYVNCFNRFPALKKLDGVNEMHITKCIDNRVKAVIIEYTVSRFRDRVHNSSDERKTQYRLMDGDALTSEMTKDISYYVHCWQEIQYGKDPELLSATDEPKHQLAKTVSHLIKQYVVHSIMSCRMPKSGF